VLHSKEHLLFVVRVIDLLRLDNLFLMQDFDGVKPEIMFTPNKMDPTETASAESALEVKVGETVGALLPTLVGERLWHSSVIYALSPFAALASALSGNRTAVFVCMGCRERLLGVRFVSEMAELVCHASNHHQGW
jgi:hypothetical protein